MEASAAWTKLQAERAAWAERLPENLEDIFPWLLAQEQATVLHLLTFVVAVTVTGIYGTEPERQSNEALARALGLDMSQWWTATGLPTSTTSPKHVSSGSSPRPSMPMPPVRWPRSRRMPW
jgi:ParB family chromosome partitioning protein